MPMPYEEQHFLFSMVYFLKPERMIEIGVSLGYSTRSIAKAMKANKKGKLISVDNWSRKHGGKASNEHTAKQKLISDGSQDYVEFVKSDSIDFLKSQKDKSCEIVWVDGNHDHHYAYNDTVEALRIATKLVIVHDTFIPGVSKAIQDIEKDLLFRGVWLNPMHGFWLCSPNDVDKGSEINRS